MVLISDLIPWKRPIQSAAYSVLSPKGTLTPKPKLQRGSKSIAKKRLGTNAVSPASPPSEPSGRPLAATLAPLENLVEGEITVPAMAKWRPRGSLAMPAGFHHTVDASSAVAAAPANALPKPLAPCSTSAKAAAPA
jgi:hypothetical protein